mmetsp:Transcript_3534/g.2572  ORF Transcript_3534/g.2572 Transcript_3534/m.2572 type:complete len:83 (+) Transcript_3534:52-300(+)
MRTLLKTLPQFVFFLLSLGLPTPLPSSLESIDFTLFENSGWVLAVLGDLVGEWNCRVFWTATFSLNFLIGSFLSTRSSSIGV